MRITESLTKRRVIELKKVREMYNVRNVGLRDSKIFFFRYQWQKQGKGILWLILKLVVQRCSLMKGKDCACFIFLLYFYFNSGDFALLHCSTHHPNMHLWSLKLLLNVSLVFLNTQILLFCCHKFFLITSVTNCSCKFWLITSVTRSY